MPAGAPSGAVIARPNSRTELMTASSAETPRRSCSSGPVIPDTGISRARSHACLSVTTSASAACQRVHMVEPIVTIRRYVCWRKPVCRPQKGNHLIRRSVQSVRPVPRNPEAAGHGVSNVRQRAPWSGAVRPVREKAVRDAAAGRPRSPGARRFKRATGPATEAQQARCAVSSKAGRNGSADHGTSSAVLPSGRSLAR